VDVKVPGKHDVPIPHRRHAGYAAIARRADEEADREHPAERDAEVLQPHDTT